MGIVFHYKNLTLEIVLRAHSSVYFDKIVYVQDPSHEKKL
jgi:hypothetical protein